MKTIIKRIDQKNCFFLSLILVIGLFSSCDSKLEEPIYNFWGDDFFSSTEKLNLGVRGVVSTFASQDTYGLNWMVFDCDTDIGHIAGAGIGHQARDLGHYNIYAAHIWLEKAWGIYYRGVDRANFILAHKDDVVVQNSPKDQATYKHLIAEVRALRALAYFDLIRLFGDVPYKDEFTILGKDDMRYERTDAQEIYEHICEELEEAVLDLPWHDEFSNGYVGRFSKGAGHALLSRIYLFRGGWSLRQSGVIERQEEYKDYYAKALEHANIVTESTKHKLNPSYSDIFKNMCEYKLEPQENILEFQFYSSSAQRGTSSVIGTYNGPSIAAGSSFGRANSYIKTHMFFYDTFDDADLRKNIAVATWKVTVVDGKNVYSEQPRDQSYNWAPAKWRRDWHTGSPQDPNYTNVNWVFLRYSDVLLMKAEAENELNGSTATAIEAMNQVRRRAYGFDPLSPESTVDYKLSDFATEEDMFREIVAERARELSFEGHRRMDLIRWNLLDKAIETTGQQFEAAIKVGTLRRYNFDAALRFTKNTHELYPIPSREILETGNTWTQNPGYEN